MPRLPSAIILLILCLLPTAWAAPTQLLPYQDGEIPEPDWFKHSFLELADDLEEASQSDKKLLIYFHQAGCGYCYNLVQQVFMDPALSDFIQQHYDVIALNLWGDRAVTLPDGTELPEKQLAKQWQVQYTPTLLFFSGSLEPLLRLNGYRKPSTMGQLLRDVAALQPGEELSTALPAGRQAARLTPTKQFADLRPDTTYSENRPVAVIFEYPGCDDCAQLHQTLLQRDDSKVNLASYQTLRVDLSHPELIPLPSGELLTARAWATQEGLDYFPSLLLFDVSGQEQFRINAYVQAFHFNAALEYVAEGIYQHTPEFQRYIDYRADLMRAEQQTPVITQ
ncbi:thioredoxin fold domain-containing protein [Pontibacter sp. JAM-7]|uniref:thioredoxin fold domain-containing protein n=1 Tax=Pontibacter sp. JAM-7 TaxID=3366581 RepID=UPI003AF444F3